MEKNSMLGTIAFLDSLPAPRSQDCLHSLIGLVIRDRILFMICHSGIRWGIGLDGNTLTLQLTLTEVATLFLSSLHGLSPTHVAARGRIGWGKTRQYTVKEGYTRLSLEPVAKDRL